MIYGSNEATTIFLRIGLLFCVGLDCSDGTRLDHSPEECGLYLAPSSIRGAGIGVYAGREFAFGENIGQPGLGIQLTDPFAIYDEREVIAEFGWNSVAVGGDAESDTVFSFLPGIGTLANFHPTLSNVLPGGLSFEPKLDRANDPGVGACTPYHNFTFIAKESISAGHEIFASVGEGWFRHHNEINGNHIPLKADYDSADKIIQGLAEFRKNNQNVREAQFLDVLRRIRREMIKDNDRLKVIIPQSIQQFDGAANRGMARTLLKEPGIDWLRQHGKCIDNIRSGTSTIPGAGRGAFATRSLQNGSVISPAPLIVVMNWRETFSVENEDFDVNDKQLLLNYCFGNKKSTLLLCPTTSVTLINHSKESNAKFVWSEVSAESNYRFLDLDELKPKSDDLSEYNARLSFDFVATKDIFPGDEILIDYGDEWEDAWARHKSVWRASESASHYTPANVMNSDKGRRILLSNDTRLHHHSYLCRLEPFAREDVIENIPEEDFRANPQILPQTWNNATRTFYGDNDYLWWWPCDVIAADANQTAFSTVVYKKSPGHEKEIIRRLRNVPREAIKYVDKPYHSDQHLPNSFRHYIPIPDNIFPLHWKEDYTTASDVRLGTKNTGLGSTEDAEEERKKFESDLQKANCGVWVAPSNIPNAGKGVYAGVTVPGRGFVLEAEVPVIPVVDMAGGAHWDANDYTWSSSNFHAEYEAGSAGSSQILAVNEGCMANFHPGLVNAAISDAVYDPLLDRRKDPGAGAFSDYVDVSFHSLHELKAGEEVFISYGEHWFQDRTYLGKVPLSAHYAEANDVIASLASLQSSSADALSDTEMGELLEVVKNGVVHNERTRIVLSSLHKASDIRNILTKNGTAEATTETKSVEWLQKNGYCTDHIYSKASTIKQAGRGAFARRLIQKGDIIIPAPLLCTWGRHMFDMKKEENIHDINRKQLAYNYQFAHPESSVLFFPTNTAITINHSSNKHNTELRWSATDKKSMYYLQRRLEDLKKEHYATMVLDFVATRDIYPGEEIFINYGDAWSNAWDTHVENYVSPCPDTLDTPCFKSSKFVTSMNSDKFNKHYHEWSEDHFTACRSSVMPLTDESIIFLTPRGQSNETVVHGSFEYSTSFRGIEHEHIGFDLANMADEWIPCWILRVDEDDRVFDVVYFTFETSTKVENANVLRRMRTLAAADIKFINKPYKSDMHWSGAFRHEIHIPDNIFPQLWKDLKNASVQ